MEWKTTTTTNTKGNEPSLEELAQRVEQLLTSGRQRYQRLWAYYRNPMRLAGVGAIGEGGPSDRPYRQAQEWGLPVRITGHRAGFDINASLPVSEVTRKEVVIENDIGWRVETMIDYLFGKPIVVDSAAPDPSRRAEISELLRLILAHNGGILFFQQLALLGSVYGFVDVLVKLIDCDKPRLLDSACSPRDLGQPPVCGNGNQDEHDDQRSTPAPRPPEPHDAASAPREGVSPVPLPADEPSRTSAADTPPRAAHLARLAGMVRLEVVEPARALPFLSPVDYRIVEAYAQCIETPKATRGATLTTTLRGTRPWTDRVRRALSHFAAMRGTADYGAGFNAESTITLDLLTPTTWRRYANGKVIAEGTNSLGTIPLVHIQNTAVPLEYGGASDVEPLIPLQDELNTRLSDRAHRITMQSFRMYLGKPRHGSDVRPRTDPPPHRAGRFRHQPGPGGTSGSPGPRLPGPLQPYA